MNSLNTQESKSLDKINPHIHTGFGWKIDLQLMTLVKVSILISGEIAHVLFINYILHMCHLRSEL